MKHCFFHRDEYYETTCPLCDREQASGSLKRDGSANCVNKGCRNYRVKLSACKYGYDVDESCETRNDESDRPTRSNKRPPGEPRWPNVKVSDAPDSAAPNRK